MNPVSLSIVLPVYKNETSLEELYRQLKLTLESFSSSYEIVFVNDASPDGSAAILQRLAQNDPQVKVIDLLKNVGQNRALILGIEQSLGSIIVMMDADLQDPPHLILPIVSKLKEGYGAVFAGRHGFYESPLRLATSKIFKFVLHKLCHLPKDAGLFVALTRSTADRLKEVVMPRPFIVAMIGLTGCKTCSIPFIREKQKEKKTAYTFSMRFHIGTSTIWYAMRARSHLCHRQKQKDYYAKADHQNIRPGNHPKHIQRQVNKVVEILSLHGEQKILEVGCGMGRFTIPLAEKKFRMEGLDLSPDLLREMNNYCSIPTYCADLLNPPSDLKGQFDIIIGFFILHHMPDLEKTFQSITELLKPGGKVLFIEPNPYNPLFYLQIFFHPKMRWKNERYMLQMRRSLLFSAMKGFSEVKLERFGFLPPFLHERFAGLDRKLENIPALYPFLPYQIFYGERK